MFENPQGIILFHVDTFHMLHISINSYSTLDLHYKVSQLIIAGENLKENLLLLLSYASVTSNHILNIIPTCKCSSLNSTKNLLFFSPDQKHYKKPQLVKIQRTIDQGVLSSSRYI